MQKKIANLCRLILSDRNTRNLFFFLLLNLFFAFVELFYGLWTNSLGLISDSFHMFFDCSALLLGLAASIVTKWKSNDKFTYGFGRAEILAGLANGLFLLFIALFIMKEAIERSFEPPEVHHERLFVISVLGFIVNLVGIFVFQHGGQGHHHGHGGCSHSHGDEGSKSKKHHSHDQCGHKHDHSHQGAHQMHPKSQNNLGAITLDMNGITGSRAEDHSHHHRQYDSNNKFAIHSGTSDHYHENDSNYRSSYEESHEQDMFLHEPVSQSKPKSKGRGQIMQSVFLHIVADTLGSIGVMISAILMNKFGWMIADPLCSLFIAILISISVYPLLRDSFYVLMQRIPVDLENELPEVLQRIHGLNGVLSVHETHFWALNSDTYVGCMKLEVSKEADFRYVMGNAKSLLNQLGIDKIHIQIDQV